MQTQNNPENNTNNEPTEVTSSLEKASQKLVTNIKEAYAAKFKEFIAAYREGIAEFPSKIEEFMGKDGRDWFRPEINLFTYQDAREELKRLGLETAAEDWSDRYVLLVMNLPKPLRQFYSKQDLFKHPADYTPADNKPIEWGHFYEELINTPWGVIQEMETESNNQLAVARINPAKHHTKDYYYVLKIIEYTPEELERYAREDAELLGDTKSILEKHAIK